MLRLLALLALIPYAADAARRNDVELMERLVASV